jgi:NADP-dependent 3-hydroxy acid dehydrogenase YdfG
MSQEKVAIIAGAGGALGHATTAVLAARGFSVVALDRNEHALSDLSDAVRKEVADPADPGALPRCCGSCSTSIWDQRCG